MPIPLDYKGLLKILNKHRVKYLVVGAYAVIYYTEPRYTKDIDIWVEPEIENAKRTYEALKDFGAPLKGMKVEDFANPNLVYQMGVEPVRVDIVMGISDIKFSYAWKRKIKTSFDGIKVNIIGIDELLESKKKARRNHDMQDIDSLKFVLKEKRRK